MEVKANMSQAAHQPTFLPAFRTTAQPLSHDGSNFQCHDRSQKWLATAGMKPPRRKPQRLLGPGLFLATFAVFTSLTTIYIYQRLNQWPVQTLSPAPVSHVLPPSQQTTLHLLRQTLRQLSLANMANTYHQFRDLAALSFQRANSAEKLRDVFPGCAPDILNSHLIA